MNRVLVIGYGNTLRGDDGAGVRAAERAAHLEGVDVATAHELLPEMAEAIARYEAVVFIDASVQTDVLRVRGIGPALPAGMPATHSRTAEELLALALGLYARAPRRALQIEIPARDLDFGDALSAPAADDVRACTEIIQSFLREQAPQHPSVLHGL